MFERILPRKHAARLLRRAHSRRRLSHAGSSTAAAFSCPSSRARRGGERDEARSYKKNEKEMLTMTRSFFFFSRGSSPDELASIDRSRKQKNLVLSRRTLSLSPLSSPQERRPRPSLISPRVRHTYPSVCRAWGERYLTQQASPFNETLEVDVAVEEVAATKAAEGRRTRLMRQLAQRAQQVDQQSCCTRRNFKRCFRR